MQSITLRPGQTFDTGLPRDLRGFFTISLTGGHGFSTHVDACTHKRSGSKLMIRDITGPATVNLAPSGASNFPANVIAYVHFTIIGRTRDDDIVMQLPAFDVSNLSTFPVATLLERNGTIHIQVADQSVDEPLSPLATGVRSALRTSIGVDSLPQNARTDVTVVFDVSASMRCTTSDDALAAMAAFAAGITSVAAQGKRITIATSSHPAVYRKAPGPDAITTFVEKHPGYTSAGWDIDHHDIDPHDAMVVISDDMPATLVQHPGTIHLLTATPPTLPHSATHTLFSEELTQAVLSGDISRMAHAAENMINALARKD
ncbi:hypothetical protein [Corynebacterium aquilae]|uniref:VWA domain-containing protein n=1 Tax=Corynebacterium aquilae DSM 44791 TaxID=1431546 RepID=A0A1L7CIB5_9CORY|nr:hypothetical protein [Corynebacterium aquilae]APT85513.1 hypothetical protein CAQU_11155 [Corynebacterium aquilae DSM 44791]